MKDKLLLLAISLFTILLPLDVGLCNGDKQLSQRIPISFLNASMMPAEKPDNSDLIELYFPAIPGVLFGNPSTNLLLKANTSNGDFFNLNLPTNVDDSATPLKVTGLTSIPTNIPILRLATYHTFPDYQNTLGAGGFINKDNGNALLLIYIAEPAKIHGEVVLGDNRYLHNLDFEKAGWNWVEMKLQTDKVYLMSGYTGTQDSIQFVVILNQ